MASLKRCYYEVLQVTRDVDEDGLKRAYRKLAMQYHPDRNPGDAEAEARFKEAAEAFDVLRDPQKRARYDRWGHAGVDAHHDFSTAESVFDIFGEILGDFFGGGGGPRRARRRRGADLQLEFEIDLVEAYRGAERTFKVPRRENCSSCGGSGAKAGSQPTTCRRCGGQGVVL